LRNKMQISEAMEPSLARKLIELQGDIAKLLLLT